MPVPPRAKSDPSVAPLPIRALRRRLINGTTPPPLRQLTVTEDARLIPAPIHLPYARRNIHLAFLQVDMDAVFTRRILTRQDILAEVRQNASCRRSPDDRSRDIRRHAALNPHIRTEANPLTVRDMRQIDPSFTATPAIWVREDALVVSLESVRAIILYNKMFIFDPDNDNLQSPLWYIKKRLTNNLEDVFLPFEFRALEGILLHSCMVLEREFLEIEPVLRRTLGVLPGHITNEHLERLRLLEQRLNHYYARARKVQHALQTVLDEDEDMADMYLTEKKKNAGAIRNPVDHDEAEMLLETYLQLVDDLTSKAELLNQAIDDTENLIEIHLDTMQNRLLLVDLLVTTITTFFSFLTMITSFFGMNFPLPNGMANLPTSQYYFYACVSAMFMFMVVALSVLFRWFRRQGIYQGLVSSSRRLRHQKQSVGKAGDDVRRHVAKVVAEPLAKLYGNTTGESWESTGRQVL